MLLAVGTTLGAVMRYGFNAPLLGLNQLGQYSLEWLCFLGVGWVLTQRGHVTIEIVRNLLVGKSEGRARKFSLSIDLVCLCYSLALLWLTGKETWEAFTEGSVLTGELGGVAACLVFSAVPIGFLCLSALLIIYVAANVLRIELVESRSDKKESK